MRRLPFTASVFAICAIMVLLVGCGGNASPSSSTTPTAPTPTATTPSTPPPSSGAGSGGSGSGGGTPAPTPASSTPSFTPPANSQFQQSIIVNGAAGHGSVYVSTGGDVTIQLTGAPSNSTYGWRFCGGGSCFDLGQSLMTDASGSGQVAFHFPKSGKWSGYFEGTSASSTVSTQFASLGTLSEIFMTEDQINGVATCFPSRPCYTDTVDSGTVTIANNNAHIVLKGTIPNDHDIVNVICDPTQKDLGYITVDASGNVIADVPLQGVSGCGITLWDHSNQPLVSGFSVP